jgi:two-component system, cell cycle sensor histidine kinase and response regulator CckA
MMAHMLEDSNIRIEEAENGAAALQLVYRLDGALSLVVTDVDMPVMDGLQFARALRRTEPRLPILFISGSDPALLADTPNAHILRKPFAVGAFLEAVKRLLADSINGGQLSI